MSSVPNNDYSLVDDNKIRATMCGVGYIGPKEATYYSEEDKSKIRNPANTVFMDLSLEQIKPGTRNRLTDGTPTIPVGMYRNLDVLGLCDSIHDFNNTFTDVVGSLTSTTATNEGTMSATQVIAANNSYRKFLFTFLLNGGYPSLLNYPTDPTTTPPPPNHEMLQSYYSKLFGVRSLNDDNIENYFSIGTIQNIINTPENGRLKILSYFYTGKSTKEKIKTKLTDDERFSVYNELATLFADYKDPAFGNKIKIICDHQVRFFDILEVGYNRGEREFCSLTSAETMVDPAPKSKIKKLQKKVGVDNCYIEYLSGTESRTHNAEDTANPFGGNVSVTFRDIQQESPTNPNVLEQNYSVNATYTCRGYPDSETLRIQMNDSAHKFNAIDTIKKVVLKTIALVSGAGAPEKNTYKFPKNMLIGDSINEFYNRFNTSVCQLNQADPNSTAGDPVKYIRKYAISYARKRLGDVLQGRVCKQEILGSLQFRGVTSSGANNATFKPASEVVRSTKDAVLVTHDRMLFSYAVRLQIPVILDLADHMILYIPPPPPPTAPLPLPLPAITEVVPPPPTETSPTMVMSGGDRNSINQNTVESIGMLIDCLIRFLSIVRRPSSNLFQTSTPFKDFIRDVNDAVARGLNYNYIQNYTNDSLFISQDAGNALQTPPNFVDKYPPSPFEINPKILHLILGESAKLEVYKIFDGPMATRENPNPERFFKFIIQFTYDGTQSTIHITQAEILRSLNRANDIDFNMIEEREFTSILNGNPEETSTSTQLDIIYEDVSINVIEEGAPSSGARTGGAVSFNVLVALVSVFILAGILAYSQQSAFLRDIRGGPNDAIHSAKSTSVSQVVVQNFELINDNSNLLEKNMAVLYSMFNMLTRYEFMLIDYIEGIEGVYHKIDSSPVSQFLGVTELFPYQVDLYIFYTLLLRDYNAQKVAVINYGLLEYCMYVHYKTNADSRAYNCLQDVKSYLNEDESDATVYEVDYLVQEMLKNNKVTGDYFYHLINETKRIKEEEVEPEINGSTYDNVDSIRILMDKYNLMFGGFANLKSIFLSKSIGIVGKLFENQDAGMYLSKYQIAARALARRHSSEASGEGKKRKQREQFKKPEEPLKYTDFKQHRPMISIKPTAFNKKMEFKPLTPYGTNGQFPLSTQQSKPLTTYNPYGPFQPNAPPSIINTNPLAMVRAFGGKQTKRPRTKKPLYKNNKRKTCKYRGIRKTRKYKARAHKNNRKTCKNKKK